MKSSTRSRLIVISIAKYGGAVADIFATAASCGAVPPAPCAQAKYAVAIQKSMVERKHPVFAPLNRRMLTASSINPEATLS